MAEERRGWEVFGQGTVKGRCGRVGRGEVSAFGFGFVCSFTLVVKRERTSSRCGGVVLKVLPMAHAVSSRTAVPGGTVT